MILSISIIGIFSTLHSGIQFVKITDERLMATNLAREWLESINALRDSFQLRSYNARDCFFTTDISNLDNAKCPRTGTKYYLLDNGTITAKTDGKMIPICINSYGWHSQESSTAGTACESTTQKCNNSTHKKSCQTEFTRSIEFSPCVGQLNLKNCTKVKTKVAWWTSSSETIELEQTLTRNK